MLIHCDVIFSGGGGGGQKSTKVFLVPTADKTMNVNKDRVEQFSILCFPTTGVTKEKL